MEPSKAMALKDPEMASVIRNALKFKRELLQLDPWLPFPQNSCCYSFGEERKPFPLGALFILWEECPEFTGPCSACGGALFGCGFGGLLSLGGVIGFCSACGSKFFRQIGGLGKTCDHVYPVLGMTPFFIKGGLFGGTFEGPRAPLVNALRQLGATGLPGDEWVQGREPSAASLSCTVGENEAEKKSGADGKILFFRMLLFLGAGLIMAALRHAGAFLAKLR